MPKAESNQNFGRFLINIPKPTFKQWQCISHDNFSTKNTEESSPTYDGELHSATDVNLSIWGKVNDTIQFAIVRQTQTWEQQELLSVLLFYRVHF